MEVLTVVSPIPEGEVDLVLCKHRSPLRRPQSVVALNIHSWADASRRSPDFRVRGTVP